ncbi:MAG TPA: HAMP domain-containing sensor histidine kinase [Acidimicrobiales bacterium]|nr:HAMP domain-containing sensor histidine kinase [Acidimicrobiales bacterium]
MSTVHQGGVARRHRVPHSALGLRARVLTAFAMGALVLSALLAAVTYGLVRENLVRQRESVATNQAYLNARYVRDSLRSTGVDVSSVLDSLTPTGGSTPVLVRQGVWFAPLGVGREELPPGLRRVVEDGRPARMRFSLDGQTQLGVGVPLPSVRAAYFEVTSFDEVERTLRSLGLSLLAAALVTTSAGAALGASVSRRVLRPLAQVSAAAEAIAGGRLDTRVARIDDADLGTLVTSFNDMASALQQRIERDARFASDVSHELRSPLTTLSASIQVLEARRGELPERARAALDLLVADVTRFSAMVEDLLEISRFDAGAAHLQLDDVRIAELVMHAIAASTEVDVPLSVEADAVDCVVQADKRRLVRVIANLIGNADTHAGGAIGVSIALVDDQVRIAVEDAGPGVDEADRERIFERFSRGSAAGSRGSGAGVGLGLALVREHVALHGGRVWVEPRHPDPGARVVVELPVVVAPQPSPDPGPAGVPAAEARA